MAAANEYETPPGLFGGDRKYSNYEDMPRPELQKVLSSLDTLAQTLDPDSEDLNKGIERTRTKVVALLKKTDNDGVARELFRQKNIRGNKKRRLLTLEETVAQNRHKRTKQDGLPEVTRELIRDAGRKNDVFHGEIKKVWIDTCPDDDAELKRTEVRYACVFMFIVSPRSHALVAV